MVEKSTTKNRLPKTYGTYCWTHGRYNNVSHTSTTCKSLAEGHDVEATWDNKKGGLRGVGELNDKARLQLQ